MTAAGDGKIIGNRYLINHKIGDGGMGLVYHATDRFTNQHVALKQVYLESPDRIKLNNSDIDYRLALAHEFKTMASLRHPNVISVLDYGFDDENHPYYTMELLPDAKPLTLIAHELDLPQQINYLVQLLHALAYLHRRGVFHRDLKPDNVLVQDNIVRILDFGLALVRNQTDPAQNASGTLAYMAPETLRGLPPTPATDLYAVGVMGYEIFMGKHPFNVSDINDLIQDVMGKMPTFTNGNIGDNAIMIIERLMLKDPVDRYQSAQSVIDALNTLVDEPVIHAPYAIRESFLQAAEFVGREFELSQLNDRLELAVQGQGQAILIGGESGVGKSRLLDELRTISLVEGADVVRGHGITEGASPYALWRETLRWLAMINPLSDFEASVLKPIIPDIEVLIGREVDDPPELSPQAIQARIIDLMETLFERYPKDCPLVVILEDVHWAGSESLKAFEHLVTQIKDVPVLIVASYRDDEAPTLPDVLNLPVITLKRLTSDEIKALSTSMLGDAGQQEQVVDLLQRETEGNIFFVIEVVRALAEESGTFDSIGKRTIPAQVFEGGLRTIINRRLEQVPSQMRELMTLCAISGRKIDVPLVQTLNDHLSQLQQVDIDNWLETLSDAAIITVIDNQWQFAHDKIREGLMITVMESEVRIYHRRVADAIETVYGDVPEQTSVLAHHWRNAGDTYKELKYVTKAGEQMLTNGAYEEAIEFLQRALTIAGTSKLKPLSRASLMRKLSAAYVAMGNLAEGESILRDALVLYGYPAPTEDELNRNLLGQLGTQIAHRILPFIFIERKVKQHDELSEAAAAHEQLVELAYYTNNSMMGLYASLRTMNISELTKPTKHLPRAYGAVSYVSMLVSDRIASMYYRKGIESAKAYGDSLSLARTLQVSTLRFVSRGEWEKAESELEQALEIYEKLGDLRFWTSGAQTLGEIYYYRGEFQRSMDMRKQVYETALRYGDTQAQGFGLRGQAMNLLVMGDLDQAEQFAQAAVSRYSASNDQIGEADAWGLMALINLYQERYRRALVNAEQVIKLTTDKAPTSYNLLLAYYTTAETLMTLYERDNGSEREKLTALIEPLLAVFKSFTRRFMIGKPRQQLYLGRWLWLTDNRGQAVKSWENGIRAADSLKMPYDKALLQHELGSHSDDAAQKNMLLAEAQTTFKHLGAQINQTHMESGTV